jgi:hypothetical protein
MDYASADLSKLGVSDDLKYTYDDNIIESNVDGEIKDFTYTVDVIVSKAGYLVLDGEYTDFEAAAAVSEQSVYSYNDQHQLIIDGVTTDYVLTINTTYGGEVPTMPLSAILLMTALCALTTPIMSLIRSLVPWIKELIANIKKIVGRL